VIREETLYLSFPEWQGSGKSNELYHGANFLRSSLAAQFPFKQIHVSPTDCSEIENGILGYKEILKQKTAAKELVRMLNPQRIFTLGGSCGVETMPISFLNHVHDHLAIIWFDAHADLNTPESSPSKHFHGMPLRLLLGEGDRTLCELLFSTLKLEQVFLAGVRDTDLEERELISSHKIFTASPDQIDSIVAAVESAGFRKIYVHIDLDVLDPNHFSGVKCPTHGGLTLDQLCGTLLQLRLAFEVVGFSILEFVPDKGNSLQQVDPINKIISAVSWESEKHVRSDFSGFSLMDS